MRNVFPAVVTVFLTFSLPLQAASDGISLGQTRVIFSADNDKAQTVTVSNRGQRAYLVQSRIQNGPDDATPAPFIITPPLYAMPGNSRQLLRILPQSAALPTDRESLFYLAVSAIPAQAEPITAVDRLSIGVRFVVKFFYRPAGLTPLTETTACQLTFGRDKQGAHVANPSPYFQTLGALTVNDRRVALERQPLMVPPFGRIALPVDGPIENVTWQTIVDHGGLSSSCQQAGSAPLDVTS